MKNLDAIVQERIQNSTAESKDLEFKERFEDKLQYWCELVKEIIAFANSGGGYILFGVDNTGKPSEWDIHQLLDIDPAKISDKITSYTNTHFSDFWINSVVKNGRQIVVVGINGTKTPIVFTQPGTFAIESGKQKTEFGRGTIYFRHGAKSEPADAEDLREAFRKALDEEKKALFEKMKVVAEAPSDYTVKVLPPGIADADADQKGISIRIVDDPNAPVYRTTDLNETHPYRQKDVIIEIKKILPELKINAHDIFSVRKAHSIEDKRRFYYKPKYSSGVYSKDFISWVVDQYQKNPRFFEEAKEKTKELSVPSKT